MKVCSHCDTGRDNRLFQHYKGKPNGWCQICRTEAERKRRLAKGIIPKIKGLVTATEKACLECGQLKLHSEFSPQKRGVFGLSAYCKDCFKNRFKPSPEKIKERTYAYRIRNRPTYLANHRLTQFKRKQGIKANNDGTLTIDVLKKLYATKICHYCNEFTARQHRTLDHRVPLIRGGTHSIKNAVMACLSCNSSKSDSTEIEFLRRRKIS